MIFRKQHSNKNTKLGGNERYISVSIDTDISIDKRNDIHVARKMVLR